VADRRPFGEFPATLARSAPCCAPAWTRARLTWSSGERNGKVHRSRASRCLRPAARRVAAPRRGRCRDATGRRLHVVRGRGAEHGHFLRSESPQQASQPPPFGAAPRQRAAHELSHGESFLTMAASHLRLPACTVRRAESGLSFGSCSPSRPWWSTRWPPGHRCCCPPTPRPGRDPRACYRAR